MSSTLPTTKRPTVWWNRFCQHTYCRKLQAWSRCDWPVLWQLLNEPRPLLSTIIKDLFLLSCSQDLMIINDGISLIILVGYVSLAVDLPLMSIIWHTILLKSYHYLLISIPVHLLSCQSYLKFQIKSLDK